MKCIYKWNYTNPMMYVADTLFINWHIIYKILPYIGTKMQQLTVTKHQKLESNEYWQKVNKIWLLSSFLFNFIAHLIQSICSSLAIDISDRYKCFKNKPIFFNTNAHFPAMPGIKSGKMQLEIACSLCYIAKRTGMSYIDVFARHLRIT